MTVLLDENECIVLIRLENEVNVALASELKSHVVNAISSRKELHIKLEDVTELDVTAMQLLYLAKKEAIKAGVRFEIDSPVPDEISTAIAEAGFDLLSARMDSK